MSNVRVWAVVKLESEHSSLPSIGSSCRRMFICQPPLKRMNVCCECRNDHKIDTEERSVRNDTGITVGDLYDEVQRLMLRLNFCARCDEEGRIDVEQGESITQGNYIYEVSFLSTPPHLYVGDDSVYQAA